MKEHEKEEKRKESKTQENDAKQQKSKEEQGTKKRIEPGKKKDIKRKVTCFLLFPSSPSLPCLILIPSMILGSPDYNSLARSGGDCRARRDM